MVKHMNMHHDCNILPSGQYTSNAKRRKVSSSPPQPPATGTDSAPVPHPLLLPSLAAAGAPTPSAGGGAAAPPLPLHVASCQFCQPSLSPAEAKARTNKDITYGVNRFGTQPKPFAFAEGIDAFSAVVGALLCSGQGPEFANSIADKICFQV